MEFPSPETDALVRRAIDGDQDAFADLFDLTIPSVYRFLRSRCRDDALADDLAQDAYIRAMRSIGTFEGASRDFLAWVMRIARNRFLDHVKSGRVKWEVAVDDTPVVVDRGSPEEEALATIEGDDLRGALTELTPDQQEIVDLRFLHGYAIAEVATITGRSQGAVKALQFRALRTLEKTLRSRGFGEVEG